MKSRDRAFFQHYLVTGAEVGAGSDGNSSGSFKRFTQTIYMGAPFLLEKVKWDIMTTGTYSLQIVDGLVASPTVIKTLFTGTLTSDGGAGQNTISLDEPYFIQPGILYLSLYNATAVQQKRNSLIMQNFGICTYGLVGYDGGYSTTGTIPSILLGSYYALLGDS